VPRWKDEGLIHAAEFVAVQGAEAEPGSADDEYRRGLAVDHPVRHRRRDQPRDRNAQPFAAGADDDQ
jgi:hypothetical protein